MYDSICCYWCVNQITITRIQTVIFILIIRFFWNFKKSHLKSLIWRQQAVKITRSTENVTNFWFQTPYIFLHFWRCCFVFAHFKCTTHFIKDVIIGCNTYQLSRQVIGPLIEIKSQNYLLLQVRKEYQL